MAWTFVSLWYGAAGVWGGRWRAGDVDGMEGKEEMRKKVKMDRQKRKKRKGDNRRHEMERKKRGRRSRKKAGRGNEER